MRFIQYLSYGILVFGLSILYTSKHVYAQDTTQSSSKTNDQNEKRKDIHLLLDLMGSKKLGEQVMIQMIQQFKVLSAKANIPDQFWEKFMSQQNMDELINNTIPIYDKHLSHEDIKGLIKFYSTPLGKRFMQKIPMITQEAMLAGQKWGQKLGQDIAKALQEAKSKP
jgi:uncharacterized protein